MPQTPSWGGATALLPRPHPPRRSGASRLRASLEAFGLSIVPPNQKSGIHPWRTHPLKILATPMNVIIYPFKSAIM